MKKTVSFVLVLLASIILMSLAGFNAAFAYGNGGDGGGGTDTSLSDFEKNSAVNVSISRPTLSRTGRNPKNASKVKLTKHPHSQFGNEVVKSNWQTRAELTESIGDLGTAGTQYGYIAYLWYIGKAVVVIPVATVWQASKHTSRTIYGIAAGKLDSVHEVNSHSLNGRIVNGFVIEGLINYREAKRGNPIPYPGPNRTHPPEQDILHFSGVK